MSAFSSVTAKNPSPRRLGTAIARISQTSAASRRVPACAGTTAGLFPATLA